jgi:hypothetical protein
MLDEIARRQQEELAAIRENQRKFEEFVKGQRDSFDVFGSP